MTAAAADSFSLKSATVADLPLKVAASALIYSGTLVMVKQDGYAAPAADTANAKYMGISGRRADNSSGADGAIEVPVQRPRYIEVNYVSPTQALVGDIATIADDLTASISGNVPLGQIVQIVKTGASGRVLVDTHVKALS